jgi:hypothetical protein
VTEQRHRGQATVELALCLPLVCVLLLAVVQVMVVVGDVLAIHLAARHAARAAAVADDPAAAAALALGGITARGLRVSADRTDRTVTVTVTATVVTDVALVGWMVPDPEVRASVTMPREPA